MAADPMASALEVFEGLQSLLNLVDTFFDEKILTTEDKNSDAILEALEQSRSGVTQLVQALVNDTPIVVGEVNSGEMLNLLSQVNQAVLALVEAMGTFGGDELVFDVKEVNSDDIEQLTSSGVQYLGEVVGALSQVQQLVAQVLVEVQNLASSEPIPVDEVHGQAVLEAVLGGFTGLNERLTEVGAVVSAITEQLNGTLNVALSGGGSLGEGLALDATVGEVRDGVDVVSQTLTTLATGVQERLDAVVASLESLAGGMPSFQGNGDPVCVELQAVGWNPVLSHAAVSEVEQYVIHSFTLNNVATRDVLVRLAQTDAMGVVTEADAKYAFHIPKEGGTIVMNLVGAPWKLPVGCGLRVWIEGVTPHVALTVMTEVRGA